MSTILLEIVLGDGPDDFVDVLLGFKLKWLQKYANQRVGTRVIDQETPQVQFTLDDIQVEGAGGKLVDRKLQAKARNMI